MKHELSINTTEFKIDDSDTPIEFYPTDDGHSIDLTTSKVELSVMKDGHHQGRFICTGENNKATLLTASLKGLSIGTYDVELWVERDGKTAIYPSDGFLQLTINENTLMITDQVTTMTLEQFQSSIAEKMDDIASQGLRGKDGNGIAKTEVSYAVSATADTPQEWNDSLQAPVPGKPYQWAKITITYTDGTSTTFYSVALSANEGQDVVHTSNDESIDGTKTFRQKASFPNGLTVYGRDFDGMFNSSVKSVLEYGAYGDGKTDDSVAIQNAINSNYGKTLLIPQGVYCISRMLQVTKPISIIMQSATLQATEPIDAVIDLAPQNSDDVAWTWSKAYERCCLKGDTTSLIDANGKANIGIKLERSASEICGFAIKDALTSEIWAGNKVFEIYAHHLHLENTNWDNTNSIGITVEASDNQFEDIIIRNCHTGIINHGNNWYRHVHPWIYNRTFANGATGVICSGHGHFESCYIDTFTYCFEVQDNSPLEAIGCMTLYNEGSYVAGSIDPLIFRVTCSGDPTISVIGGTYNGSSLCTTNFSNVQAGIKELGCLYYNINDRTGA